MRGFVGRQALVLWVWMGVLVGRPSVAEAGEILTHTGHGVAQAPGKIKKKDVLGYREMALLDAQKKAVWKAILALGIDEVVRAQQATIEGEVLPVARALVSETVIVDELQGPSQYEVTVRVGIDRDRLVTELETVGITVALAASRMTVGVLIEEYFKADETPAAQQVARELHVHETSYVDTAFQESSVASASDRSLDAAASASHEEAVIGAARGRGGAAVVGAASQTTASGHVRASEQEAYAAAESSGSYADGHTFDLSLVEYFPPEALKLAVPDPYSGAAIAQQLLRADVRLVESRAAHEMRQTLAGGGSVVHTMADGERLGEIAVQFGLRYGTDAVLIGATSITYDGVEGGVHKATASLAARVVDSSTGDVLASTARSQAALAEDASTAAASAGRRVGEIVGDDLQRQLVTYWTRRAERGWELVIQLSGASSDDGYAAERVLGAVPGVVGVAQRFADANTGTVEVVVTTKDPPRTVRSALASALRADPATAAWAESSAAGGVWRFAVP